MSLSRRTILGGAGVLPLLPSQDPQKRELHAPTTSKSGASSSARFTPSTMSLWSSAMRTFISES